MTARRVQVIKEHIIQTDDANELKCGAQCQFFVDGQLSSAINYCRLKGYSQSIIDRNRTEACMSGDVRAMGGGNA